MQAETIYVNNFNLGKFLKWLNIVQLIWISIHIFINMDILHINFVDTIIQIVGAKAAKENGTSDEYFLFHYNS